MDEFIFSLENFLSAKPSVGIQSWAFDHRVKAALLPSSLVLYFDLGAAYKLNGGSRADIKDCLGLLFFCWLTSDILFTIVHYLATKNVEMRPNDAI